MMLGAQLEIVGMAIALSPLAIILPYSIYLLARLIIEEQKLNKEKEQN